MGKIEWVESMYATGVKEIDEQHKTLFEKMNTVLEATEPTGMKEKLRSLFDDLGKFAVGHFSCEEKIMEERKCSVCKKNKEAHGWFLSKFKELSDKLDKEGNSRSFQEDYEKTVLGWIRSHILIIDKKLAETS